MEIIDYTSGEGSKTVRNRNPYAPQWDESGGFRYLMVGGSGSGKTNALVSLIIDHLEYDTISVYAKSLNQPIYRRLMDHVKLAQEALEQKIESLNRREKKNKTGIKHEPWQIGHFGSELSDIKPLSEYDDSKQNLVVFDDFLLDKKAENVITEFFVRSRHRGCSLIYLSQSYTKTPINVRRNCDFFSFFKLPQGRDLNLIWNDVGGALDKDTFKRMFLAATTERFSFFTVDQRTSNDKLRYRIKFDGLFE
jgi:hypothetical protein